MAVAGLTRLALHRMRHDVWLYLILLLGWIAATALGAAVPVYVDALHQRVLRLELQEGSHSHRPAFGFLFLSLDRDSSPTLIAGDAQRLSEYDRLASYMDSGFTADMALPVTARMHYVRSDLFQLFPAGAGTYGRGDEPLEHFSLGFLSDLAGQAELLSGRLPAPDAPDATTVTSAARMPTAEPIRMPVDLPLRWPMRKLRPTAIAKPQPAAIRTSLCTPVVA